MGEVDGSHWHPQSPVISLNISKYSQADVVGLYTTWYWTWNSKAYRPKLCNMVVIYKALCGQLQITSSYFKRSISECTYKTALIYTLTSLKKTSTEQHEYSLQEIPGWAEQVKWHHKEAIKHRKHSVNLYLLSWWMSEWMMAEWVTWLSSEILIHLSLLFLGLSLVKEK